MTTTTTPKPAFKLNAKVTHAVHGTGVVKEINHASNGVWVAADFGDKRNPHIKRVRPSALQKV